MNIVQRMLTAAAVVIFGTVLYACGSSSTSATASLSQADFDKLLAASSTITAIQSGLTTVQDSADKLTGQMSRLGFVGHVGKSGSASSSRATLSVSPDFGQCSDMGIWKGSTGGVSIALSTVEARQTCMNFIYMVSTVNGSIQPLTEIDWTGPGCTGTPMVEAGSLTPKLQANGVVFKVLHGGEIRMVKPTDGTVTRTVVSGEGIDGSCTDLTNPSPGISVYLPDLNDPQVTGVPNTDIPVPFSDGAP